MGWMQSSFGASSLPERPRCFTASAHVVKCLLVLQCVHARPKAVVPVGGQLLEPDEALKWLLDQLLSLFEVIEDFALEREEATVDPEVGAADVPDVSDQLVVTDRNRMKALAGADAKEAGDL